MDLSALKSPVGALAVVGTLALSRYAFSFARLVVNLFVLPGIPVRLPPVPVLGA